MSTLTHRIVGNDIYQRVVVYELTAADSEDPDLHIAEPLYKWEKSDAGQFVMNNALEPPKWHRQMDYQLYGYRYCVTAWLRSQDATYFCLRWR